MVQQYRTINGLALEVFVGSFAGLLMGISVQGAQGELYKGVYVKPYTLLSPAPLEFLVPLYGLLIGLAVGLAGAPAGVKIFGEEKPVYWREAAAGHNRVSYYIGKTFASVYRLTLSSLHFAAIYYFLATPMLSFGTQFLVTFLMFFGVYGLAAIVSMLVKRENANLLAVVFGLFAAVFCGYGPTLTQASDWNIIFIWEMSFNKWGAEAMYSASLEPYRGVFDIDASAEQFGYTLGQVGKDLGIMFVIGIVQRVVAFGLLIWTNRDKQR
ncbi:hypothetical protein HK104_003993 [Borealophlyctis nickersoniae]|nr:hypothetical protein HK104_003993 [Borealophlyctis nickersoniae]